MTVNLETATLLTALGFVLGFFSNVLAMRKMFVSKVEFSEYRDTIEKMCETKRAACSSLHTNIETIQRDLGELFKLMRENHGKLERLMGKLEANNPGQNRYGA